MEKRKVVDDFKTVVGSRCYESFLELLKEIGPDSRTERISVVIAGFLRFALNKAFDDQTEGSLSEALVNLEEDPYSEDEQYGDVVLELVDEICRETNMRNSRTTARGTDYSIAQQVLAEYCRWHSMPWED